MADDRRDTADRLDAVNPQFVDPGLTLSEQIADLPIDQLMQHGPPQLRPREAGVVGLHAAGGLAPQRHGEQLAEFQQAEFQARRRRRACRRPRCRPRRRLAASNSGRLAPLCLSARAACPSSTSCDRVQAGEVRITPLELLDDPQRLPVVAKPRRLAQAAVERLFAGMAERRMADIVLHGQGLDQVFVQPQRPGERPGDQIHLDRVRQPAAMIVAQFAGENLRLVAQPAIGGAMDDAVAIAGERGAVGMRRLGMPPTGRIAAAGIA